MSRLLITGGSGFVGGHLLDQARGVWEVSATFHSRPFSFEGVFLYPMDLSMEKDIETVIEKVQPHMIIHTAAIPDLEACEGDPKGAFHINTTATEILAEQAARWNSRFVFVSTDMVFDGKRGNYSEKDETHPVNVYGKTKLAAEKFVRALCPNAVIARSALIYGPPLTGSNSFSERILKQVREGKAMPLFTDQFRSPVLVQNLAEALLELAGSDFAGTIHLGGSQRVDRYMFGCCLAGVKGFSKDLLKPVSMDDVRTEAPRPRDASLNIALAKEVLKTELLGYEEGLEKA